MFADTTSATTFTDPWAFNAHPEVWALVVFFIGAYVYMARVIGPRAVPAGQAPVSRRQIACFTGAVGLFWFAADWPVHDIGENYLYSVHMFQHLVFSYLVPPLALMSIPTWMARTIIGEGKAYRVFRYFTTAVVAGVIFNVVVMILHIPVLVNASTENGALHYGLHLLVVTTATLMWCPVLGPFEELRLGHLGKCIYLFLMSVVPTVPAGWLTFAEGVVYKHYNEPVRVWGLSVTNDQQIAGAIMKLGGSTFLWAIIIFVFFKRFGTGDDKTSYVRARKQEPQPLTYDQVTAAFERSQAPVVDGSTGRPVSGTSLPAKHTARDER